METKRQELYKELNLTDEQKKLLEENKNMWDEAYTYSYHIKSGYYDFFKSKVLLNIRNIFNHNFTFIVIVIYLKLYYFRRSRF